MYRCTDTFTTLHALAETGSVFSFPMKLLYTSTMPIVLHSAAVSALYMVSQLLHHYSQLGVWKEASHAAVVPVGGLAYQVTGPARLAADPLHVRARLRRAAAGLVRASVPGLGDRLGVLGEGRRQAAHRPAPGVAWKA